MLLILLFCLVPMHSKSQSDQSSYDLLWKLEKNNRTSYLFGTMHVKDARAFHFSDSVLLALENCDYFALELHPDSLVNFFDYNLDSKSPEDVLSVDELQRLKRKFKKQTGVDYDNIDIQNNIALKEILSKEKHNKPQRKTFLDAYLLGVAKTLQKEIVGLEKMQDQLAFLNGSEEIRSDLLQYIEEDSAFTDHFEKFVSAYARGNLASLERFTGDITEDSLMIGRNQIMANSIHKVHQNNSLFSAVGAAHLIGPHSVLELLRKEGFEVNRVKAHFTGLADKFSIEPLKMKWHKHIDKKMGFQIETPGPLIKGKGEAFEAIDMHVMLDLTGNSSFFTFNVDLRLMPDKSEKEVKKAFFKHFLKNKNTKSSKKFNRNGYAFQEIFLEAADGSSGRMQYVIKDKVLFCNAVFGYFNSPFPKEQERFFNSFEWIEKEKAQKREKIWSQDQAAFRIDFKKNPKYELRYIPFEDEADTREIKAHTYTEVDLDQGLVKIVAYNDLLSGYYIEDPRDQLNEVFVQLSQTSTVTTSIDTLDIDGYEAWRFKLNVQGSYPGEMMILYRGNRYYSVLEMRISEKEGDVPGTFLDSFEFIETQNVELEEHTFPDHNYSISLFDSDFYTELTAYSYTDIFDSIMTISIQNPMSAGHYVLEKAYLKEFIRYENADSLLWDISKNSLNWYDSITDFEFNLRNGHPTLRLSYSNLYANKEEKFFSWYDGNGIYFLQSQNTEEDFGRNYLDSIVYSFEILEPANKFDLTSSKSEIISNYLTSSDSSFQNSALGSFDYYMWQKDELPLLHDLLLNNTIEDKLKNSLQNKVVDELILLQDSSSFDCLVKAYPLFNNFLKEKVLSQLIDFDRKDAYDIYFSLLKSDPPQNEKHEYGAFLDVLTDSLDLLLENFDIVMQLSKSGHYKREILYMLNDLLDEKPSFETRVQKEISHLCSRAFDDLDQFKISDKDSRDYDLIIPYLEMAERVNYPHFIGPYTNLISTLEGEWMYNEALEARLYNHLPVSKIELKSALKNDFTRFEILEVLQRSGQLDRVKQKFLKHELLAKTAILEFLDHEGSFSNDFEYLGNFYSVEGTYHCYEVSFEYRKKPCLGIAGPFENGQIPKLSTLNAYTSWENIEDNWKDQAMKDLPDLKKFGLQSKF
ncbi:MAG: TraB/GumN family protein [Bacteroidota bacterium]